MTNPPTDNNSAGQPPHQNPGNTGSNGQQTPPTGQQGQQPPFGYPGYPPQAGQQPYAGYYPPMPYGYPQYPGYYPQPGEYNQAAGQMPPGQGGYYPPAGQWPAQPPQQSVAQPVPGMSATGQMPPMGTAMPAGTPPTGMPGTAGVPGMETPPTPVQIDPNATGTLAGREEHYFQIPPHPNTQFDEENFLNLLEGSISLTLPEKQKVIDAIPRLSIEQINELIKIFEEEKEKFKELESQYADDVAKLKKQREAEFTVAEVNQEEESEAEAEAREAEELKRKLLGSE